MKIGSLCSGYGGLDMAVQAALGGELAWVSDIDKGSRKLLAHRHPDIPNLGDFTVTDWSTVEPVDVLTAGFPCQPVSHAGKRLGDNDERWLWDDVARAVGELRPGLVVLENVRGLLSAGGGRLFGRVLGTLAAHGYDAQWHGLRAADVGAPHGRWRVFIVATRRDAERPIHGGDHGRGGLHSYRAAEAGHLLGSGRVDHVLQGAGHDAARSCDVWGQPHHAEAGRPLGDQGGMLVLEDYEREVCRLLEADAAASRGEEGTRPAGDSLSRDGEADAAGRGAGSPLVGDAEGARRGRVALHEAAQSDGSRSSLLPTPRSSDANGAGAHGEGGVDLRTAVSLLPTPRATGGTKGGPNQRGSSGDLMLPSAVIDMALLPAPTSRDHKGANQRGDTSCLHGAILDGNGNGHGPSLAIEAQRLLPTPSVADTEGGRKHRSGERSGELLLNGIAHHQEWGQYADAIVRWEAITRPAPPPAETGPKGNPRLSAAFSEWLMGLPEGWITDVPGITRNEALKLAGNGVVPQQCEAAVRFLLSVIPMGVAA